MGIRIISAVAAIALTSFIALYFKTNGFLYICIGVSLVAIFEYWRLAFARGNWPRHLQLAFSVITILIYLTSIYNMTLAGTALAVGTSIFFAMALLTIENNDNLTEILRACGIASVGFVYCGLFSAFATDLLRLSNGPVWLVGLMVIVFSGDTFAYLVGRFFGKAKLLEPVSPKKTIEGAFGGLIGSCFAGVAYGIFFLPGRPAGTLLVLSLVTGAFAQIGDLFESLLKRVADVKDSGAIMPGHGGILDRIDGLLFAAPVYYALARLLS